ncbi:MAG: hypothetical protein HYV26_14965 [Candidatus Hydrogenedentes bacterium]|nr:hypothetical protein [Candidatus Hydrogenedentota bacterium]MBI3118886.1 hypothetical protein [Candidatus Hydrogenedentota bacterium]
MSLDNLFTDDTLLTAAAAVVGLVWSLVKGSEQFQRLRDQRAQRAVQVLEAAVEETYRTYVQTIKAARADGKLTPEERRRARELARARAYAIARTEGIDLLRDLGERFLDLWIAKLVKRLKSTQP